jgi:hypothetical protein
MDYITIFSSFCYKIIKKFQGETMKKTTIISFLAVLVFAPSAWADRWEGFEKRQTDHQIKHAQKRYFARPHQRRPVHRHHIHRPHHVVVHHLHPSAVHIRFGGLRYRYHNGTFYRPYRRGFRIVPAPIGAVLDTLPYGYTKVYINHRPYFRYNNIYYKPIRNRRYRVVKAPREYATNSCNTTYHYQIGDIALNLPIGAVEVFIDGRHYYEAEGHYFKRVRRNGRVVYEVVRI